MINRSSGVAWSTYEAMHVLGWGLGRDQRFKSALLHLSLTKGVENQ